MMSDSDEKNKDLVDHDLGHEAGSRAMDQALW